MTATALVVDDDPKIRRMLRHLLEDDGIAVLEAADRAETIASLGAPGLSVITLDIQLGSDNGVDVLREIRSRSDVPVIMVSAKDDVIDKVLGLEIGADDYITKPFHMREVLARIHAVLRRHPAAASPAVADPAPMAEPAYCVDGLKVLPDRMEVIGRDGASHEVTTADFKLLCIFLDRPKRVLSRDQLMDLIGGAEWSPLDRTVDNQIARLRKKIEREPSSPRLIKTVRGVGYMLADDVIRCDP